MLNPRSRQRPSGSEGQVDEARSDSPGKWRVAGGGDQRQALRLPRLLPGFKPAGSCTSTTRQRCLDAEEADAHPVHHAAVTALNAKMYCLAASTFLRRATGWNPVDEAWSRAGDGRLAGASPHAHGAWQRSRRRGGKFYVIGGPARCRREHADDPPAPAAALLRQCGGVRSATNKCGRVLRCPRLQSHGRRGGERQDLCNRRALSGLHHRLAGEHQLGAGLRSSGGLLVTKNPCRQRAAGSTPPV